VEIAQSFVCVFDISRAENLGSVTPSNLGVFENRVVRRIFGLKREKVTGGWRRLLNEELHNLYASPNIIRMIKSKRMRWAGHVGRMTEMINVNNVFIGKSVGKRPLGRTRRR
jgi:hypothetical protein